VSTECINTTSAGILISIELRN